MTLQGSPTRPDRMAHDLFASSLRCWCNSDDEQAPSATDFSLAWINALASRLLVGSKVDLMKIFSLDGLGSVETEFLKVAVPNLAYFAKPVHSTQSYEVSSAALRKWAGLPLDGSGPTAPPSSLLMNRIKFKNVLLKLLTNATKDRRIRRMQQFLVNPAEMESSDSEEPDGSAASSSRELAADPSLSDEHENRGHKGFLEFEATSSYRCRDDSDLKEAVYTMEEGPPTTPNACDLLNLVDPSRVPRLFIEYVEPTPGLFSPLSFKRRDPGSMGARLTRPRGPQSPNSRWVESLRGGYVPAHIHLSP